MITFKKPGLENVAEIRQYLEPNTWKSCDFCPGTLILWGDFFHYAYAIVEETFVLAQMEGEKVSAVTFPVGRPENQDRAVREIMAYFQDQQIPPRFMNVNPEIEDRLEGLFPGRFETEYDRNNADYIYLTEKMASLSGRKLHSKKNHINHFLTDHPDYVYEPITPENRRYCFRLEDSWNEDIAESSDSRTESRLEKEADYEEAAIAFALNHMEDLGLKGGVLKVSGKVAAFTIGEPLTKDCFVVHFEKAISAIQGAYPMINREFVRAEMQGKYTYVNREEDMGVEGLRKSKLSYYPEILYEKGIAREKKA